MAAEWVTGKTLWIRMGILVCVIVFVWIYFFHIQPHPYRKVWIGVVAPMDRPASQLIEHGTEATVFRWNLNGGIFSLMIKEDKCTPKTLINEAQILYSYQTVENLLGVIVAADSTHSRVWQYKQGMPVFYAVDSASADQAVNSLLKAIKENYTINREIIYSIVSSQTKQYPVSEVPH